MPGLEPKRELPRFPYVAAGLCAACLATAVWLWMRYSYCWDVAPGQLAGSRTSARESKWDGCYVTFQSVPRDLNAFSLSNDPLDCIFIRGQVGVFSDEHGTALELPSQRHSDLGWDGTLDGLPVLRPAEAAGVSSGELVSWSGRASYLDGVFTDIRGLGPVVIVIDPTASPWTGASIAGLVVGAMGVFVFSVALRHWLREHRAAVAQAAP